MKTIKKCKKGDLVMLPHYNHICVTPFYSGYLQEYIEIYRKP